MSIPTLQQIYNDLQNPIVDLGAAAMGLGAFLREISAFLLKVITLLKSPTGQKEIKDVATLAADFQQAATDAGHPAPAQVNQAVNTILAALPVTQIQPPQPTVPKAPLILLAFLLAGAGIAHADVAPPVGLTAPAPTAIAGWCAGPGFGAGTSLYQANKSYALNPANYVYGAATYGLYLGSWDDGVFTPTWFLQVQGSLGTDSGTPEQAVGGSLGYFIGSVGYGVTVQRLVNAGGIPGALIGFGGSYQFSGYVPFLYLGKPGN